jgi:predicted nucleotidyltransferase component of viral defense system
MLRYNAIPDSVREVLTALAPLPALGSFSLAGGTSLALRFGHRVSVDLDFFTRAAFDPGNLLSALPLDVTEVARAEGSVTLDAGGTKIDFLRHDYPLLEAEEVLEGVRLMSLRDVAAMKLNAIANRGSKKDFFDLHRLLHSYRLEELLQAFEAKYPKSDRFVVLRSLAWFEEAEQEPDPISLDGVGWEEVKRSVVEALRDI